LDDVLGSVMFVPYLARDPLADGAEYRIFALTLTLTLTLNQVERRLQRADARQRARCGGVANPNP